MSVNKKEPPRKIESQPTSSDESADEQAQVTTKYGDRVNSTTDHTTPDAFTENSEQLQSEFLGHDDKTSASNEQSSVEVEAGSEHKYGHLVGDNSIEQIDNTEVKEVQCTPRKEHIPVASTHAENRFYSRRNSADSERAPENIYEAWRTGVEVGVDHYELDNFYGYHTAKYHEIADVIMLMNYDGIIETVINNFDDTVVINTDHLLTCGDPTCNQLYNRDEDDYCCHWCGYSKEAGRNKSEPELLPQTSSPPY